METFESNNLQNKPEAANDNIETEFPANDNIETETPANDGAEIQVRVSAELLKQELANPKLIATLAQTIEADPKLQSRLGLENLEHLDIELELGKSIRNLENMTGQLIDIMELIAIIMVNPKGLIKEYKKTVMVVGQNNAILDEMSNKLDRLTSSESKLEVVAGYLGKLVMQANPAKATSKFVTYVSQLVGIINEEEYTQMQETAKGIGTPILNTWICYQLLKNNPDLAKTIYNATKQATTEYQENKKAA